MEFKQIVQVTPGFDKRSNEDGKNYGISGCKIRFVLLGDKGAVHFVILTNWFPPHVQREQRKLQHAHAVRFDTIEPTGCDVGYHSITQIHDSQEPQECDILPGGVCYCDGSALRADDWISPFIMGGTKWLWEALELEYKLRFE